MSEQDDSHSGDDYPGYGGFAVDGQYPASEDPASEDPASEYPASGQYPGYGRYQGSETPPPTYLPWAIATTVLCFIPAGIVSWIYASQVTRKWRMGDFDGAVRASLRARNWAIASAVLAVVGLVIIFSAHPSGTGGLPCSYRAARCDA